VDFYKIKIEAPRDGPPKLVPDWTVGRTKDLMVRGRSFYALWDETKGLWSTDEYDVQRLVDQSLHSYNKENKGVYIVMDLKDFGTGSWAMFRKYLQNISDNSHQLDGKLVFSNTQVKKEDYASHRLPYSLEKGESNAWDELLGVLYSEEERAKIEWAIGAVVSGDSKLLQKFFVFYGPAGSGKSTILNIIDKMFSGYTAAFDAKALGGNNNAFSTEVFKTNPLVAIQHDGDLSGISDNTMLNSVISHEEMTMNEKYKPSYSSRVNAMLFMGTNQPVKISDAKSGILRRLIDIHPSGMTIDADRYDVLMQRIQFEYGAIAHQCLTRYKKMGKSHYNAYRPVEMMLQTDVFYNYIESIFDVLKADDGITLKQAYARYKEYCAETGIEKLLPQYKFREELRNYFENFDERLTVDSVLLYSYYSKFKRLAPQSAFVDQSEEYQLVFDEQPSVFDLLYPELPAQYGKDSGGPRTYWDKVNTTLSEIDTKQLHYVKIPEHHIIIDFDLTDEDGEKDVDINIREASKWPATYAELSKSGAGIHLHYFYTGNVQELASVFDVGIEVKTLLGKSSLRRQLSLCNDLDISTITSGLPIKEKTMLEPNTIKSEKSLRDLIGRNLRKEIHPGTKSSVDFIHKILEDAYNSDVPFNCMDLRPRIFAFAASSTHQASTSLKVVQSMQFASEVEHNEVPDEVAKESPITFYDVEVFPNLFVVCWKYAGDANVVEMINPTQDEIENLFKLRLVGFNNRRYDNHILYARFLGKSIEQLYELSKRIIDNDRSASFGEAYNLSYADIFDFSSKKQSLKKFEIELGIHHMELDLPWDKPVDESLWPMVVKYCCNDVVATEKVFEDRHQDFVARQILSELSGLSVNQTTQNHTAKIIFGGDKDPQSKFKYTNLAEEFPGYEFNAGESTYRDEVVGEGGYVYAEPGTYEDVALLDVASMHPKSIELLNLFGPYTDRFVAIMQARLAIKHGDYQRAGDLLGGDRIRELVNSLEGDVDRAEALSFALKICINIVYGLTSAKFPNAFKDIRNIDNIVAKRGALFMIDLKHAVKEKGWVVAHIKTDSIKIPNATQEMVEFVTEFGAKYGYTFEHEATYDKLCLVNEAVYIARQGDKWTAVGKQFQHPYVYKTLFTNETVLFDDFCETRSVKQGVMYLDFNDDPEIRKKDLVHVGRTGAFMPVNHGGGRLLRVNVDKEYAVTGTKGHFWIEREAAHERELADELEIDMAFFDKLKDDAVAQIEKYGPYSEFVS
jgi:phage/plasmid-associated DNA primase